MVTDAGTLLSFVFLRDDGSSGAGRGIGYWERTEGYRLVGGRGRKGGSGQAPSTSSGQGQYSDLSGGPCSVAAGKGFRMGKSFGWGTARAEAALLGVSRRTFIPPIRQLVDESARQKL